MFQKEVADKLVAQPGSKNYGRLSVLMGLLTTSNILFNFCFELIDFKLLIPDKIFFHSIDHFL